MIINKNVVSLTNEQLAECKGTEPATIGHFLNAGFNTVSFTASLPGHRVIGRAVTLKIPSMDSTLMHKVTEMVGPGDILMVDRGGDLQYAPLGGGVAYALKMNRVEAVILDGAATDIGEIQEEGLLVYYRRLSAITTRLMGVDGEINTPISCGGVAVNPGDIVIADDNGFIVLNPADAMAVCKKALGMQANEPVELEKMKTQHITMAKLWGADKLIAAKMGK